MATANSLYHQNLSALLYSSDYTVYYTLGENILVGPGSMSPASIEGAWRASAPALGQHHQPIVQRRRHRLRPGARRPDLGRPGVRWPLIRTRLLRAKRPQPWAAASSRPSGTGSTCSVVTQTRRVTYCGVSRALGNGQKFRITGSIDSCAG